MLSYDPHILLMGFDLCVLKNVLDPSFVAEFCARVSFYNHFWFSFAILNQQSFCVQDQVQWVWIGIHVGSLGFCFIVFIIAVVWFHKYFC